MRDGKPPLKTLSPHSTVHHPSSEQVNSKNCILAIMLLFYPANGTSGDRRGSSFGLKLPNTKKRPASTRDGAAQRRALTVRRAYGSGYLGG